MLLLILCKLPMVLLLLLIQWKLKKRLNESDAELLQIAIIEIKQRFYSNSSEICVPFKINLGESMKITIPKSGDKKSLVDLSLRNAKFFRLDKLKQIKIVDPEAHVERILSQAKLDLKLQRIPSHIECFDNSNLMGTNPVSSCVVFKNAKASKKDYRLYKICLLYTSPSPRDGLLSRMPSSA